MKNKQYPVVLRLLQPHLAQIILWQSVYFTIFSVIAFLVSFMTKDLLNAFQLNQPEYFKRVILYAVLLLALMPVLFLSNYLNQKYIQTQWVQLKTKVYESIVHYKISRARLRHSGQVIYSVSDGLSKYSDFVQNSFGSVIKDAIVVTGCIVLLLVMDWRILLVSLASAAICCVSLFFVKPMKAAADVSVETGRKEQQTLIDVVDTLSVFHVYRGAYRFFRHVRQDWDGARQARLREGKISKLYELGFWIANLSREAFIVYFSAVICGLPIGTVYFYVNISSYITGAIVNITEKAGMLQVAKISAEVVDEILSLPREDAALPDGREYWAADPAIEVRGLSFAYGQRKIFENFHATIRSCTCVGLRGAIGSGKSTLVKLLLGILAPDKGEIVIQGRRVQGTADAAPLVSYIDQNCSLFMGSVEQNITGFATQVDEERLKESVSMARLDEVINTLPEGLQTGVEEGGCNLSGGQRQRVALARALYKDTPIIVMDEPTSALDISLTHEMIEMIRRLKERKTVVLITHDATLNGVMDAIIPIDEKHNLEGVLS